MKGNKGRGGHLVSAIGKAVGAEDAAHLVGKLGLGRLQLHEGVIEPQLTPLELAHLVEGEHIHPLHIAQPGSIASQGGDILQLVGEPRHQHIAQPDRDATGSQLLREIQRRLQGLPGHSPVLLRVPCLDIQQYQVGIRQQGIIGIATEVAGGIDAGVQPHFLAPSEQGSERRRRVKP